MRRRNLLPSRRGRRRPPIGYASSGDCMRARALTVSRWGLLASVLILLAAGCSPSTPGATPAPLPRTSAEAHHEQAIPAWPATRSAETRHSDDPIEEQWFAEMRDHPAFWRDQGAQLEVLMRILPGVPEPQFSQ